MIASITMETGLSKKDATASLDATIKTITDVLSSGENVSITGFGTFSVKERPEREGRIPVTGEKMVIRASKTPVFKAEKDRRCCVVIIVPISFMMRRRKNTSVTARWMRTIFIMSRRERTAPTIGMVMNIVW